MNTITKIDAVPLAIGLQKLLLEMVKDGKEGKYPCRLFEDLIVTTKGVSREDAERVTEKIINTGILRWEMGANCFVL